MKSTYLNGREPECPRDARTHLTQVCCPARAQSGTSHRDVTSAPLVRAAGRAHRSSNLANVVFQMCLSFLLEAAAGGFG